jgi:hypothetical protein
MSPFLMFFVGMRAEAKLRSYREARVRIPTSDAATAWFGTVASLVL